MRPFVRLITAASLLLCGGVQAMTGEDAVPPGAGAAPAIPPQSLPRRSSDIALVQSRLSDLGYAVGKVDGRLGPRTRKAINAYLAERGLPQTGWVTPELMDEVQGAAKPPAPTATRQTEPKVRGTVVHDSLRQVEPEKVVIVQRRLKEMGYYDGPVDGVVRGRLTEAIKAYQTATNSPATGWIFPDLVAELEMPQPVPAPEAAPTPAPPPVTWHPRDLTGKTLHALPGDLLGRVEDVVIEADGTVAGIVAAIESGYGSYRGTTLIPWSQVARVVARPALILPLNAEQGMKLRTNPPPFTLGSRQMLGSALGEARARFEGRRWGSVKEAVFTQDGHLLNLMVQGDDAQQPLAVPASTLGLAPEDGAVDLKERPVIERYESGAS